MSNTFTKNKQEFSGVKLVGSTEVWEKTRNGKHRIQQDVDVIGKIDTTSPHMILKANRAGTKTAYIQILCIIQTNILGGVKKSK
jgi:hypothetical protein